jgi:hypothetical protein
MQDVYAMKVNMGNRQSVTAAIPLPTSNRETPSCCKFKNNIYLLEMLLKGHGMDSSNSISDVALKKFSECIGRI